MCRRKAQITSVSTHMKTTPHPPSSFPTLFCVLWFFGVLVLCCLVVYLFPIRLFPSRRNQECRTSLCFLVSQSGCLSGVGWCEFTCAQLLQPGTEQHSNKTSAFSWQVLLNIALHYIIIVPKNCIPTLTKVSTMTL